MAGTRVQGRRVRIWPGVAAPLGLTMLLTVAAWLFQAKVAADQAEVDANNARRAGYARQEAAEIARQAKNLAGAFADARTAARREQEKNLRLEARGILDSVYRHLTASLDNARKNAAARREVRAFPPGFDGMQVFLELAPSGVDADDAVAMLRAAHPELASLLPAGCSLAVIEDYSRQLFSIGGGVPPEDAAVAAVTRDFIFNDGGRTRQWSLRLEIVAPDAHPLPDAARTAAFVGEKMRGISLKGLAWQGWLLGKGGKVEAVFGPDGDPVETPPYIDIANEWVDADGRRLVWLEKAGRAAGLDWEPAVAVTIPKPVPPPELSDELLGDTRWCMTLAVLAVLTLVGWAWFVRTLFSSRPALAPGAAVPPPAPPPPAASAPARRRLIRDGASGRSIPDVQGVIVADIGDDGQVRLKGPQPAETVAAPPAGPQFVKPKMPAGSLFRLQSIHRGRENARGSRVLDQARSPVLKELAGRVRPSSDGPEAQPPRPARPGPSGTTGEPLPSMKSPTGWKKVGE